LGEIRGDLFFLFLRGLKRKDSNTLAEAMDGRAPQE